MACFYNLNRKVRQSDIVAGTQKAVADGRFNPDDPGRMCEVIRNTEKQCLAFKILAAARLAGTQEQAAEAFACAFENIKPGDAVVVGMFPKQFFMLKVIPAAMCSLSLASETKVSHSE